MGRKRSNNAKHERVGIYIMPATRNKLNLLKIRWAIDTGTSMMSQDQTIARLIDIYEKQNGAHHVSA